MLNELMGIMPNAALNGQPIDDLIEFCHWFMLILFVGWSAFFLYTLWYFHQSRNPKADYYGARAGWSSHVEFSVVLIEAVILLGFAIPLWYRHIEQLPAPERATSVVVRAIGEQFLWNFHYPGADRKFGEVRAGLMSGSNPVGLNRNDPSAKDDVVVTGEVHLPVNQDVIVEIFAKDVIHNFAVPAMRVAQDAVPGMRIPIWFRPIQVSPVDDLGEAKPYEIVCGQLCGSGHGVMRAYMIVDQPGDFEAWLKSKAPAAGATDPATPTTEAQQHSSTAVPVQSGPNG
jgi:cytochrome c oxidase subunit 2